MAKDKESFVGISLAGWVGAILLLCLGSSVYFTGYIPSAFIVVDFGIIFCAIQAIKNGDCLLGTTEILVVIYLALTYGRGSYLY